MMVAVDGMAQAVWELCGRDADLPLSDYGAQRLEDFLLLASCPEPPSSVDVGAYVVRPSGTYLVAVNPAGCDPVWWTLKSELVARLSLGTYVYARVPAALATAARERGIAAFDEALYRTFLSFPAWDRVGGREP